MAVAAASLSMAPRRLLMACDKNVLVLNADNGHQWTSRQNYQLIAAVLAP